MAFKVGDPNPGSTKADIKTRLLDMLDDLDINSFVIEQDILDMTRLGEFSRAYAPTRHRRIIVNAEAPERIPSLSERLVAAEADNERLRQRIIDLEVEAERHDEYCDDEPFGPW